MFDRRCVGRAVRATWTVLVTLVGCRALPPPPVLPPHAWTAAEPQGVTTAMLVVGMAASVSGFGDAWGMAVRVEHQQTDRSTLGVELTGGDAGHAVLESRRQLPRLWLVGLRVYDRFAPESRQELALSTGAGVSLTASGLVTGTLHAGIAVSSSSTHLAPITSLGLALAVPLRRGEGIVPDEFRVGPPEPRLDAGPDDPDPYHRRSYVARTELYLAGGLGLLVPLGDSGNRLSADVSFARGLRDRTFLVSLTAADGQRTQSQTDSTASARSR